MRSINVPPQMLGLHLRTSELGFDIALLEVRHLRLPQRISRDKRDLIGPVCEQQNMGTRVWQDKPSQDPNSVR